ncbi:Mediator of RNA polymerase II transcription subunit 19 [Lamellibrachia satsuma]|nr:Mediator of RNA polymerase II transcription subunit 19 [Lamellibrachia satsuma]
MSDIGRQNSPKSSPRGSRSPAYPRQDSTGTLKTTITLGKNPSVFHSGAFYLMKEPPEQGELTGSTNLMAYYGLEHSYNKYCSKKLKEELSTFLPNLPGNIDTPGLHDNSSLRSVIEKPPITGKELIPLSGAALTGFRLHPGPLPEQYRVTSHMPQKKKHRKHRKEAREGIVLEHQEVITDISSEHKKTKKTKKNDEERKKRKKEKKKKKEKEKEEKAPSSA